MSYSLVLYLSPKTQVVDIRQEAGGHESLAGGEAVCDSNDKGQRRRDEGLGHGQGDG